MRWCASIWGACRAVEVGRPVKLLGYGFFDLGLDDPWATSHDDAFATLASRQWPWRAVWLWTCALERHLGPSAFTTGYLLLAAVLFLALYNVRKKLPFLPLGSSAAWLQWHMYVGIGSVGVICTSCGYPLADGAA